MRNTGLGSDCREAAGVAAGGSGETEQAFGEEGRRLRSRWRYMVAAAELAWMLEGDGYERPFDT